MLFMAVCVGLYSKTSVYPQSEIYELKEDAFPREYVVLTNKLFAMNDGKKIKDYKYMDVIKINKIEMKGKTYVGFSDSGEIDMMMTNYIFDRKNYFVNQRNMGVYYKTMAIIPKMKYLLYDHSEAKYYSENLDIYYRRGIRKDNTGLFDNVKTYIILNGQKMYYTKEHGEPLKGDNYGGERQTMAVGIPIYSGRSWVYISVTYTPSYRMIALRTAFSMTVEQLKEYKGELK